MLTDLQQDEVRDVMLLNLDSVTNATQLAELAASLLDLEEELDDPDSELWELAADYFEDSQNPYTLRFNYKRNHSHTQNLNDLRRVPTYDSIGHHIII